MVELAGISPFGGGGVNIRQHSEAPAPTVPAVESSGAGQGLSGRMSSGQSQTDSGAGQHTQQQMRAVTAQVKRIDRDAVPGPPPTFQISLLEMDRNLTETLARINAAHAIARDADAIAGPQAEAVPQDPANDNASEPKPAETVRAETDTTPLVADRKIEPYSAA